ncbi:YbaB/EbfC DNA-binding family protein [Lentzea albidocapillata subsp. violacea]|uniref:YbaB/EbfC DNA-binding family protein n=1 Tax=Lentzea albidocapillata subsp. violacea TaxID=128104 RepID=A0A1G8WEQ6_9PSEU|nr:YbaB/EbfC family nucleoid-associated protein [Lentzea albidocapillata]SDJ76175.1 YbaB/EbfC DNA-binding family protein [Lentzea albidocapillata subsp. violacea]
MAAVNEERLRATEQLQREIGVLTATAEHPNGLCMVTASPKGEIRALHLHPALLGQGAQAVGQVVTETVQLATNAAVQVSFNKMALALGDGMAIDVESIAGDSPFRSTWNPVVPPKDPAEQAPPERRQRPPRVEDPDEDAFFENPLWRR